MYRNLKCNAELVLCNSAEEQCNQLVISHDNVQDQDAVSLTMFCRDEIVPINLEGTEHHFRLTKQQILFLTDFLKRTCELMGPSV